MRHDKEATKQAFARRFCAALKQLGYFVNQQTEIGELFGVSGQAVRRWADGVGMPATSRMNHVADILGVRRAWLQDGEEPMRPVVGTPVHEGKEVESMPISDDEIDLLLAYRQLTPQQRKVLRSIALLLRNGEKK